MTRHVLRTGILLVLISIARLSAKSQAANPRTDSAANPTSASMPMPIASPAAGEWNYRTTITLANGTKLVGPYSVAVKDAEGAWVITGHWPKSGMMPGEMTDVMVLERGTLLLRKESLRRFPNPSQDQEPAVTNVEIGAKRVTGTTSADGTTKPISVGLSAAVFAGGVAIDFALGCLPLADGYKGDYRYWSIQQAKEGLLHFKVLGTERITVATGTFDSWKIELSTVDGAETGTVWIDKDSRVPVKSGGSGRAGGGTVFSSTELVP